MTGKYDFEDGRGPVPAHQHINGGGWVEETATVEKSARIEERARVSGDARVSGAAWVSGAADLISISPIGREANGCLTAHRLKDGSMLCNRGCFSGNLTALESAVQQTHGDNEHGRIYRAAIALIRAKFEVKT